MGRGEVEADEVHQQDAAVKEAGVSVQRGVQPRKRSGAGELQRPQSVQDPRGSQEHTPTSPSSRRGMAQACALLILEAVCPMYC